MSFSSKYSACISQDACLIPCPEWVHLAIKKAICVGLPALLSLESVDVE